LTNNIVFHKLQPYKVNKQEDDMAKQKTNMEAVKATKAVEEENQAYIKQLGKLCEAAGGPNTSSNYDIKVANGTDGDQFIINHRNFRSNSPCVQILRIAAGCQSICDHSVKDNANETTIKFTDEGFEEKVQNATIMAGQLRSIYEKTNFVINPSPKEGETSVPEVPEQLRNALVSYLNQEKETIERNKAISGGTRTNINSQIQGIATRVGSHQVERLLLERALDAHPVLKEFTSQIMGQGAAQQRSA
jgi:hypothetical protein